MWTNTGSPRDRITLFFQTHPHHLTTHFYNMSLSFGRRQQPDARSIVHAAEIFPQEVLHASRRASEARSQQKLQQQERCDADADAEFSNSRSSSYLTTIDATASTLILPSPSDTIMSSATRITGDIHYSIATDCSDDSSQQDTRTYHTTTATTTSSFFSSNRSLYNTLAEGSLSPTMEEGAPHPASIEALLQFFYSGSVDAALAYLHGSDQKMEALVGMARNIAFVGSCENDLYDMLARWSIPYTADLVSSAEWNCQNIRFPFLRRWVAVNRAQDATTDELSRCMILLWWALGRRQGAMARLQQVLPLIQFEFILQSTLLRELQSHISHKSSSSSLSAAAAIEKQQQQQQQQTVQNFSLNEQAMAIIIQHAWSTYQTQQESLKDSSKLSSKNKSAAKSNSSGKKMHRMKQFFSKIMDKRQRA